MEIDPTIEQQVALFFEKKQPGLAEKIGMEFTKLAPAEVVGTMPVDERTRQPFGVLHGGASVALAETLASVGAWLNCDPHSQTAAGMEINANHIRPVQSGTVTGTATGLHLGRQTQVWQITICNEQDKLVCVSRCTLSIIPLHSG